MGQKEESMRIILDLDIILDIIAFVLFIPLSIFFLFLFLAIFDCYQVSGMLATLISIPCVGVFRSIVDY